MHASDIPTKYPIPFANSARSGYIETVPFTSASDPSKASFITGFSELNFLQEAAGGFPPWGADFNGLFNLITKWQQWMQAGGGVAFDSAFAASVGGYPKGALVQSNTLTSLLSMFVNLSDTNSTDPNASPTPTTWEQFPEANVQVQKPNFANDTSATLNQYVISLSRKPRSFTEIIGSPVRFRAAATNSINNPQININGLGFVTMVNVDSTALGIGQLIADGSAITEGMIRADGLFQINFPQKSSGSVGGPGFPFAGATMPWFNETVPSGWLEIGGQLLVIASFPALWAVLGTRYGGDGVTTFRMPNSRGTFLRGWDHGRGLDPDAASRTNAGGGITGDHVGTNQPDGFKQHDHPNGVAPGLHSTGVDFSFSGGTNAVILNGGVPFDLAVDSGPATGGGSETRPVNIDVMWIMFTG